MASYNFGGVIMKYDSVAKSIEMFKAVLAGKTYEAVGKTSGMTRSAVEQRVKALARDLQAVVGVEGVDEDVMPSVESMRTWKECYLEALEHYQPERVTGRRGRNAAVTEKEIDLAVERTRQMSNCKNRDVALLLVLFATAAKPLEIARLQVCDYLRADGSVREESVMRPEVAVNGKARPLFFSSAKANAAIDTYLEERLQRGHGVTETASYRGLDPVSRLFLTNEGNEMPIRIRQKGHQRHYHCGMILDIYRKIFARTGMKGVSALSARRTVAQKLKERGTDDEDIGRLLGLKEKNSVRNLLPREPQPLKAVVKELV